MVAQQHFLELYVERISEDKKKKKKQPKNQVFHSFIFRGQLKGTCHLTQKKKTPKNCID